MKHSKTTSKQINNDKYRKMKITKKNNRGTKTKTQLKNIVGITMKWKGKVWKTYKK